MHAVEGNRRPRQPWRFGTVKRRIANWVRHAGNPIVRPTPGWDADACYKPYAVYANGRWMLWYNGRKESLEQIGLVTHSGEDLRFVAKSEAQG
jgi:beta-1,2-mannobiose phosphorylase / 1,2-beta-oligomannan phosphorylase